METVQIPSPTPGSMSRFGDGFRGTRGNCSMNGTAPNFNFPPAGFRMSGGDMNQGPIFLGVGSALLFISILLLAARLWSRLHPVYRLKIDDWTVLAATVCYSLLPPSTANTGPQILAIVQYFLLIISVLNGFGRRTFFVPPARRSTALRYLFISQVFWYWSVTLVKLSVALLLLRLKQTRPWRSFLYLIMAIAISAAIVQTCFQFLQCRPFSVFWDPRGFRSAVCFRRSIIDGNIIVFSSIQVALDIIFSFIPIMFVRKLKLPRREKIFMCMLMGLGLFASIAAIVRTLMLQEYYTTPDTFRSGVMITLYAVIEQHLALMAATVPTLKSFMETTLVRAGLWFYDEKSEGHVRGELVKLGLLDEGEFLAKNEEEVARRMVGGTRVTKTQTSGGTGKVGEVRTESVVPSRDGEVSFEEMLAISAKEKEFV
ncbi:uncharacterized protein CC84DRAFT_1157588 [Paraphaeosphaeria sporulosa]|uniref:Rhodopsin domain-containing protein n=1 Tax=Paraphaeosphaeria sporulosa TaxID=1460663 RepID=A0A177BWJ6_9PLEO|nr:uncharacterized protein CC84DRAFT_1157588 [Paraphaeosphaeria sporulosa]OAF99505.1 hypothetical protein CC84DRAFT_1157588 [Paraphaeosphaeria sporulosa]